MKEYEVRFPRSTPGLNFIKSPGERCFKTDCTVICETTNLYKERDNWWWHVIKITSSDHGHHTLRQSLSSLPFTVENRIHYLENQWHVQWPKKLVFYSGSLQAFLTTEIILFYKNKASKGKSCDILVIPLVCIPW